MAIDQLPITPNAPLEDYIRQMELEQGMRLAGEQRYDRIIQRSIKNQVEDETTYGRRLISHHVNTLSTAIEAWLDQGNRRKAGRGFAAIGLLEGSKPDVLAYLTLKAVFGSLTRPTPTTNVCIKIGTLVEDELRCVDLRHRDSLTYDNLLKAASKKSEYRKKHDTLIYLYRQRDNLEWNDWSTTQKIHVGAALLSLVIEQVGLVENTKTLERKQNGRSFQRDYITPLPETLQWIRKHMSIMRSLSPVLEPMIVPPLRWKEGMSIGGGYLSNAIPSIPMVKTKSKTYLMKLKHTPMPVVRAALNAAQETAWRINRNVLSALKQVAESNSELGGLPPAEDYPIPPKPHDIETNEEAKKEYRQRAAQAHQLNVQMRSKRLSLYATIATAEKYREFECLYFPHQLDFRGRLYSVTNGGLSPQGADYSKALLEFADGHPITEEGISWLKVHTANLFGVDKVSFDDRVTWCTENMPMLLRCAADPLVYREWADADKPYQALAACIELAGVHRDGADHITRLPIALDGSCSGLQNLGMALRCKDTGKSVNLTPRDKPADIYQDVADKCQSILMDKLGFDPAGKSKAEIQSIALEKLIGFLAENGITDPKQVGKIMSKESVKEKNQVFKQARALYFEVTECAAWLRFDISRKVCKRPVMTYPYGSKAYGFKQQILEDTIRPYRKELELLCQRGEISRQELEARWPFQGDGYQAAGVLADVIYSAVKATVVKAGEIMDWMQACAKLVAAEEQPICWTTPLGFPVQQEYRKTEQLRIDTKLAGRAWRPAIQSMLPEMNVVRNGNAISPNVVHSLDSSHLALVVSNARQEGMSSFSLIHDSFGVRADQTPRFFEIIRESFVQLYQENYFVYLNKTFADQLPIDKRQELPRLPDEGDLDISLVLQSKYAFA